jgi:DNA-binding transcriptional MerR regulator
MLDELLDRLLVSEYCVLRLCYDGHVLAGVLACQRGGHSEHVDAIVWLIFEQVDSPAKGRVYIRLMPQALKIGEVSKETGLSVKAIRFYEKIGLMPRPERSFGSGYRLYTEADVRRLRLLQRFKLLGLKLSEIKEIVAALKLKGKGCECSTIKPHLRRSVDQQLQEVERKIDELMHLRQELKKIQNNSDRVPLPQGFCLCSEPPLIPLRSKSGHEIL